MVETFKILNFLFDIYKVISFVFHVQYMYHLKTEYYQYNL